jgi:hypothetical protein
MAVPVSEMLRIHLHFDDGLRSVSAWFPASPPVTGTFAGSEERLTDPDEFRRFLEVFRVDAVLIVGDEAPRLELAQLRRLAPTEIVGFLSEKLRSPVGAGEKTAAGWPDAADDQPGWLGISNLIVLSTSTWRARAPELLETFRGNC